MWTFSVATCLLGMCVWNVETDFPIPEFGDELKCNIQASLREGYRDQYELTWPFYSKSSECFNITETR